MVKKKKCDCRWHKILTWYNFQSLIMLTIMILSTIRFSQTDNWTFIIISLLTLIILKIINIEDSIDKIRGE